MKQNSVWVQPWFRALAALILVLILGSIFNADGAFFKWATHQGMLRFISIFGILACGMTCVIITAGIDLSVGSVLGFVSVLFALTSIHWGWSPWAAIPFCLLAGTLCGLLSGVLIARFTIQPFIATLAMMVFARGLAKSVSGGRKVSQALQHEDGSFEYVDLPPIFEVLDSKIWGGHISMVTLIFLISALLCWVLLAKLRWGRYLYAIGGNEEASRLSGVPVTLTKLLAYGLAGMLSAVAGICQAAQETQGDPEAGVSYELTAIAIVVIGGTNLMGGRGGIGLTLIGALTIGYLEKILSINGIEEATRLMLTGLIIVAAVLLQRTKK